MEPDNPLLDDYTLSLVGRKRPRICFIPTASGDAEGYIDRFMAAFGPSRASATVLRLFHPERDRIAPERLIASQDILYIGGGSVANALAIWRLHGIDRLLKEFWADGRVLTGVSAGMNCWFRGCITDSFGPLAPIRQGLGILSGSACPHYDGERDRRPAFRGAILAGDLPAGYAADDGAALHFVGKELIACVSSRPGAKAYRVMRKNGRITEQPLEIRYLG